MDKGKLDQSRAFETKNKIRGSRLESHVKKRWWGNEKNVVAEVLQLGDFQKTSWPGRWGPAMKNRTQLHTERMRGGSRE